MHQEATWLTPFLAPPTTYVHLSHHKNSEECKDTFPVISRLVILFNV